MKKAEVLSCVLMLAIFASSSVLFGQQVVGTFPTMEGGLESQSAGNLSNTLSPTAWSVSSTSNGVHAVSASGGRSGPKYVSFSYTAASTKRLQTPQAPVQTATAYTVQFYYKTADATAPTNTRIGVGTNGTSNNAYATIALTGTTGVWTKAAGQVTSSSTSGPYGMGIFQANGTLGAVTMDIDDFVVYPGTTDATAPDPPTTPTTPSIGSTQMTVSWTAPLTGVDGGGYLVVRKQGSDPTTAPNVNGIYALGNIVASDEFVVYIGTNTTFNDNGLTPETQYYYRIYTVDKAFNYSIAATINATTTGLVLSSEPTSQVTNIVFSNVTQTSFDVSWTPAASGGGTNHLVVMRHGSAVNTNPTDGGSYTASPAFGSGSQLGAGNYVVFNGTGNTVSITGLTKLTRYYVSIYDFNGSSGSENYLTSSPATGNQLSLPGEIVSNGTSSAGVSWNTAGAWVGGIVPTASDNATVVAGDKLLIASSQSCYNLTIQAGGKVYNNTAVPTSSLQYLTIYGTTATINGTLGDKIADGTADGALGIQFANDLAITGSGLIRPCRIRPASGVQNVTLTVDADVELTYSGTTGTGGSGLYTDNSSNDNISIVVNSGKTLAGVVNCNFATTSSTATDGNANTTLLINGTLSMPGGFLSLRMAAGKSCNVTVNGLLSIGKDLLPTGTAGTTSSIIVNGGGEIRMIGYGRSALFDVPTQVVTGGGTFTVLDGAGVSVGAAAGLDATNGPIRTATRSFSSTGLYTYSGSVAQVTGPDLPATVGNLVINNTSGVTLSNNITISDTLSAIGAGALLMTGPHIFTNNSTRFGISGTFQIDDGGWATGANDFVYYSTGTLAFNTTTNYGVNNDPPRFWPDSTYNVNVMNTGGITLNLPRTVRTLFQTAAGVSNSFGNNLYIMGRMQLNGGGYFNNFSPTYSDTSTLIYNTGSSYGAWREWELGVATGYGVPKNVTIQNGTALLFNTGSRTLFGTLSITNGSLNLSGNNLTLDPGATLSETPGNMVFGTSGVITTTRSLNAPAGTDIGGLGLGITSSADLGSTVITRGHAVQTGGGNNSIKRYFEITPTTNTGLNATFTFKYDESELNGLTESGLLLWKDVSGSWVDMGGSVDQALNTITLSGVNDFSRWTAAQGPLPVQLASFTAQSVGAGVVRLDWRTISEINNYGFEVQRSANETSQYASVSDLIMGHGTSSTPHEYSFIDRQAGAGDWYYRLKQIDLDGTIHYTDPVRITALTDVVEKAPKAFVLQQNYPNPFNPSTEIKFSVETTSSATIVIYNSLGQKVATLFDEVAEAGRFYKVRFSGENLSSGTYYCRLINGKKSDMRKLVLVK